LTNETSNVIIGYQADSLSYSTKNEKAFYRASVNDHDLYPAVRYQAGEGYIQSTDEEQIKTGDTLIRVIEAMQPELVLNRAVNFIPTASIAFQMALEKTTKAQEKVGELQEIELIKDDLIPIDFRLWKNGKAIASSDEGLMMTEQRLKFSRSILNCAKALAVSKNGQIRTELISTSATAAASTAWTTGTANPYTDINKAIKSVVKENGHCNVMIANRDVWAAFFALDKVKGQLLGATIPTSQTAFPVQGLPGITGLLDEEFPAATAVLCNTDRYVGLAQGPITAEYYRASGKGGNLYAVRDFMQAKKMVNDAGFKLTGLVA
jgi:hypothetical protein